MALLQNADKLFADGKFAEAQTAYENAGKDLKKTVLEGRALIGAAASAGAQDASKGIEAFAKVAADKSLDAVYSAQANYLLGLYYAKAGKTAEAKTRLIFNRNRKTRGKSPAHFFCAVRFFMKK